MVIDPESYYLENLKGKTAVQIMTKIRGLKREIARLKRVLEHPNYECKKKPSELTQLNCTQQYFLWRCIKKEAHKIMPYNVVLKKVI